MDVTTYYDTYLEVNILFYVDFVLNDKICMLESFCEFKKRAVGACWRKYLKINTYSELQSNIIFHHITVNSSGIIE